MLLIKDKVSGFKKTVESSGYFFFLLESNSDDSFAVFALRTLFEDNEDSNQDNNTNHTNSRQSVH